MLIAQTAIHFTFLLNALAIASTDRMMSYGKTSTQTFSKALR